MSDILIKKSPVQGKGVFAKRNFSKGEIVIKWNTTHILIAEEVKKLPKNEQEYVSAYDGKYILFQEPERYVNHSCEPNTKAMNNSDIAIKNIKKDEEIITDYGTYDAIGQDFTCNCGSKNCRKVIKRKNVKRLS